MKFSPQHIDSLLEVSQTLMKREDTAGVIEDLLDIAMETLKAERGFLVIQSEQEDEPILRSARNIEVNKLDDNRNISFSIIKEVIRQKKPILTKDASVDSRFQGQESIKIHGIRSVACVPLLKENQSLGALYVDSRGFQDIFNQETINYMTVVASFAALALDNALKLEKLEEQNRILSEDISRQKGFSGIIGTSTAISRVFDLLPRIAPSQLPVLILGESGTGKELIARALHNNSPRRDKPFLAVYCGNIPENLLESELFGHAKGAFTGATSAKKGMLELADGGTFLLDEIADIPLNLQTKLLRFLQESEIRPVGDNVIRRVNVRILAATNKNILEMVESGAFREDLFYRLNVLTLKVPSLRERIEDIPLLALYFLEKHCKLNEKPLLRIGKKTLKLLQMNDYPGNIRELENIIARAVVMCTGDKIDMDDIVFDKNMNGLPAAKKSHSSLDMKTAMKEHARKVLNLTNGNRSEAKRLLNISRTYLYTLIDEMKEDGIEV